MSARCASHRGRGRRGRVVSDRASSRARMTLPHRVPELCPPCGLGTLARPTRAGRARSGTDGVGRAPPRRATGDMDKDGDMDKNKERDVEMPYSETIECHQAGC
jgi:hypothetical protein